MKNNILFFIAIIFALSANAQTKLTYKNHAYIVGDKHDFFIAQNVNEGKDGANVTWDFSGLIPSGSLTSYMLDPAATPNGLNVKGSNLALVENENTFYFNVSKSGLAQNGSLTGNSLASYDKPFEKLKFPFAYGDVAKGDYSGAAGADKNTTDISGSYKVEGDAWGTLILPNGVYNNTLRVKQTRTYKYNNGTETTEITYRWYTSSVRYPLLVIIKYDNNGSSSVIKVAYFAHYTNENLKDASEPLNAGNVSDNTVTISPNPVVDHITVNYKLNDKSKVSIDLYDASGVLIKNLSAPMAKDPDTYSDEFNISLNPGSYYLKTTIGKTVTVKKLIKM